MNKTRIFVNGRIFVSDDAQKAATEFASCMVIHDDKIVHVGNDEDNIITKDYRDSAEIINLDGKVIIPSFIDAHAHLLFFGLSLRKLDLTECSSFEQLQSAIRSYAKAHPELPRILCRGWQQASTGRSALATMLDDLDEMKRPIYLEALDLHSSWINSAAIDELPVEDFEKFGKYQIPCDDTGRPTGLFAEGGITDVIWPHLNQWYTTEDKQAALQTAFDTYLAAGYTGAIDMAMDDNAWDALKLYRERNGRLPIHIAAHWLIRPVGDLEEQVDTAIAHHEQWHPSRTPDFCITGVKLICDGTVDGCTAALTQPYPGHDELIDPLFSESAMNLVVTRAASAGLQVAIHAIGNRAITQAINSIELANTPLGRHRIEHLEVTNVEDAQRLGKLGITASVQPVHSDPAILRDYPKLVGPHLWDRAFAYKEFLEGHACVALGTDAPTARHFPLLNMYNATTRRSAMEPQMTERINPRQALTMSQAFYAATAGAAYSRFAESWTGSLKTGLQANFVILSSDWTPETLLDACVEETWSLGQRFSQTAKS